MGSLVDFADLYHTGIVVDDFDGAKEELSAVHGVTWGAQGTVEVPCLLADGPRLVTFTYAYTVEGPHHLELVRAIPGTLWTVGAPGQAHHLGYWCDDVAGTSAALTAKGLPRVAKVGADEEDTPAGVIYHQARTGAYIELVDRASRAFLFGDAS